MPTTAIPNSLPKVNLPAVPELASKKKLDLPGITNMTTPNKVPTFLKQNSYDKAYELGAKFASLNTEKLAFGGAYGSGLMKLLQGLKSGVGTQRGAMANYGIGAGTAAKNMGRSMGNTWRGLEAGERGAMRNLAIGGGIGGGIGAGYAMGGNEEPTYKLGPFSYNGPSLGQMFRG